MRLPLIVCLLVAACEGDHPEGITIQVMPTAGVTEIELLVPDYCSGACPGRITPKAFGKQLGAKLLEVKDPTQIWRVGLIDGTAVFRIVNDGDGPVRLPLIAAVGYKAKEAVAVAIIDGVDIVPGESKLWRLPLAPASPIDPQSPAGDGEYRILQWATADTTQPSCVVIERGSDRFAIGPESDNDCDEALVQPECAPWHYQAEGLDGTIATANCAIYEPYGGSTTTFTCLARGPLCNEVMPSGGCHPLDEEYCLADPLCEAGMLWSPSAISTRLAQLNTHIECDVPVDQQRVLCSNDVRFLPTPISSHLSAFPSTCIDLSLNEITDTIGPFSSRADLPDNTSLEVESFSSGMAELRWRGDQMTPAYALASLDLDNQKHIVLPVVVRFVELGCAAAAECRLVPGSSLDPAFVCADTPPMSSCGPTDSCSRPVCGNTCCKDGERCIGGSCVCGSGQACPVGMTCEATPLGNGCGGSCCASDGMPPCEF